MEKEIETNQVKKRNQKLGGIVFVGCMFIGMGLGKLLGETGIGMFVGMGVGFICMAMLMDRKTN